MTSVQVDPTGTPDNAQAPPLSLPVTGGTDLAAILDGVHDAVLAFDGDWRIGYLNAAAVAWLGAEAEGLLGRSAWMVLPDVAVPLLVEDLQRAATEQVTVTTEIYDPSQATWRRIRAQPFANGLLLFASDVTAQKRREDRIAKLQALTTALSVILGRDELANVIVDHTGAMMGANLVALAALSEDGREFVTLKVVGCPEDTTRRLARVPADAPMMFADAVRQREPMFIETWAERIARYPYFAEAVTPIIGGNGAGAALPLLIGGRPIGALGFGFPTDREFDHEERDFLRAIADVCAQALERSRLYESERAARAAAEAVDAQDQATLALLDTLLGTSPNGFAFFDTELRFQRVNQALAAMNGVAIEEHLGRTPDEIVPAPVPSQVPNLRRVLESGEPLLDLEVTGETGAAPGEVRHWLASFFPVRGGEERLLGVGATVVEITERKRFEERLRRSEERLRVALGGSPIVVYQQDRELRYTWLYNFQGAPEEQLLGKTDAEMLPPEEAAALMALKRRVLETGVVERAEIRATTSLGAVYYDLTVEPVRDDAGEIVGVTGSAVDISDRREREERIAKLQQLTAALAGAVDAEAVARAIVDHGVAAVGANLGLVAVLSGDGRELVTHAVVGFEPTAAQARQRVALDDPTAIADAVRRQEPIYLESWQERIERYPRAAQFHAVGGDGAAVALPLLVEGRPVGALGFGFPTDREFDGEARDFLRALADLCAQALERARLYDAERHARDDAQEAERRLALLVEISGQLASTLDFEDTVARVARLVVPALADWCAVELGSANEPPQLVALAAADPAEEFRIRTFATSSPAPI
ncbi:MAG TPA: PAS domain-containing protein, partial [Thermomicrobiales bacterium]|nr:PAS domain-containing protein [Thermomicrobiales bacterium]